MSSYWSNVAAAPKDKIFGLKEDFLKDSRPTITDQPAAELGQAKVNISAGVYLDESGTVPVMRAFKLAKERLFGAHSSDSYQAIRGNADYIRCMQELLVSSDSDILKDGGRSLASVQTLGGTGALRIAGDFLKLAYPAAQLHISEPTWANHRGIFTAAGFEPIAYPYYDLRTHRIDFDAFIAYLNALPLSDSIGHVFVLHTCCHNPTGADFSVEQWRELKDIFCKRRDFFAIFDFAYQGFGSGLQEDAFPIHLFNEEGLAFAICQSTSKNCSLYGQRVGCLSIIVDSQEEKDKIENVLATQIVRRSYSNPPKFGSDLVTEVLSDPTLRAEWEAELKHIRERIASLRVEFVEHLKARGLEEFSYIANERGMFSVLGFTPEQDLRSRTDYGVYLPAGGRIAFPSLTSTNMAYVADMIKALWNSG